MKSFKTYATLVLCGLLVMGGFAFKNWKCRTFFPDVSLLTCYMFAK